MAPSSFATLPTYFSRFIMPPTTSWSTVLPTSALLKILEAPSLAIEILATPSVKILPALSVVCMESRRSCLQRWYPWPTSFSGFLWSRGWQLSLRSVWPRSFAFDHNVASTWSTLLPDIGEFTTCSVASILAPPALAQTSSNSSVIESATDDIRDIALQTELESFLLRYSIGFSGVSSCCTFCVSCCGCCCCCCFWELSSFNVFWSQVVSVSVSSSSSYKVLNCLPDASSEKSSSRERRHLRSKPWHQTIVA